MPTLIDVLKNLLVKMTATQTVHVKKNTEALPLKEFLEYARAFAAILTPVRDEDAVFHKGLHECNGLLRVGTRLGYPIKILTVIFNKMP